MRENRSLQSIKVSGVINIKILSSKNMVAHYK